MLDPKCKTCGDVGHYRLDVPFGHPQFGKLIRCHCMANEDAKRLQRISGLSDKERSLKLSHIVESHGSGTARMLQACKMFVAEPVGIVTFWGGSGNGKTLALQAVINHFVDQNREAIYITAFDLISHIRAAFHKSEKNDLQVNDSDAYSRLMQFERVSILAIDEFDKINVTAWVREQLTDLIDRRYRLGVDGTAGTLIAMNDDPNNLPPWISSRLSQNIIIHNADADMRPAFKEDRQMAFDDPEAAFDSMEHLIK